MLIERTIVGIVVEFPKGWKAETKIPSVAAHLETENDPTKGTEPGDDERTRNEARPLRLLLVEDNPADAQIFTYLLKESLLPVVIDLATDGEEATDYLFNRKQYSKTPHPDLILLDINLPKKNGFEVLAELRQDPILSDIPVYIISTTKNEQDVKRAYALNVAGYHVKPTELSEFEKLVKNLTEIEFPKVIFSAGDWTHSLKTSRPVKEDKMKPGHSGDELFRQLVAAVKDYAIYLLDPFGKVLSWNAGAQRIKGYTPAEIIGKHFSIFYEAEDIRIHHPQKELEIAAKVDRYEEEGWRLKKDGTRFWAGVTITAIRDRNGKLIGFGKVTRDLSERRNFEVSLKESEQKFRLLVEGVKDYGIFLLSPEGIITSWNLGAERIKGYRAAEIIGKHFSIFYTKDALEKNHPQYELRIAAEKGRYEEEGLRIRKDGTTFWANLVITALRDENGVLQGFSKITRDITDKKRVEQSVQALASDLELRVGERTEELELSKKELQFQKDRLSRSNAELQQFAYIASHDLQEPLRSVVATLQLMERRLGDSNPDEVRRLASLATDNALRMKSLIEGVLTYSEIGSVHSVKTEVDCNQVLEETLHTLQPVISETKTTIEADPLPTCPGDGSQLTQLFQNLISNSIKYRSDRPCHIRITTEETKDEWIFSFADNGIGIENKYLERIFVMFQRLHSDRKKYSGTGIGLAICKKIVEGLAGRIWATSQLGEGTTVRFSIPKSV